MKLLSRKAGMLAGLALGLCFSSVTYAAESAAFAAAFPSSTTPVTWGAAQAYNNAMERYKKTVDGLHLRYQIDQSNIETLKSKPDSPQNRASLEAINKDMAVVSSDLSKQQEVLSVLQNFTGLNSKQKSALQQMSVSDVEKLQTAPIDHRLSDALNANIKTVMSAPPFSMIARTGQTYQEKAPNLRTIAHVVTDGSASLVVKPRVSQERSRFDYRQAPRGRFKFY